MLNLWPPTPAQLLAAWEHGLVDESARAGAILAAVSGAPPSLVDGLPLGTRNRNLLHTRALLFGPRAEMIADCAACGDRLEVTLPVTELVSPRGSETAEQTIELRRDGYELAIRLPTGADLVGLPDDIDLATQQLLARCVIMTEPIATAEGAGAAASPPAFPPDLIAAIEGALTEVDPDAIVEVQLICPTCGDAQLTPVDPVAFLWAEVDAWAWQLLTDINALASAYGWSEDHILAMAPTRRQAYLYLCGATEDPV